MIIFASFNGSDPAPFESMSMDADGVATLMSANGSETMVYPGDPVTVTITL